MYKLMLCWRYLRTRYLALICIISVMLGVATLIVVNAVMSGFGNKLKERLHGLLSDIVIESPSYGGFPMQPEEMMSRIQASSIGQHVEAMTPTIEIFAMMQYRAGLRGEVITRAVRLIGVDPKGRSAIGGFAEFLTDPKRREDPHFELTPEMKARVEFFRRRNAMMQPRMSERPEVLIENEPPPPDPPPSSAPEDRGIIVGYAIASFRAQTNDPLQPLKDVMLLEPGDQVQVTTVGAAEMRPVFSNFVVCDYFKSEMSEYDSNCVFVPLDYLQKIRGMEGRATCLQIRLTDFDHAKDVVRELRNLFGNNGEYLVSTWMDKQGPLLGAIDVERGILNLLLFMIVGVAGFSILAIFSMIVGEKTRDIGILKSLGASNRGVMSIFLGYGLLLGIVGAGFGTTLGLWITENINEIEQFLTKYTGRELFPRDLYYFDKIPTYVDPLSVGLIVFGAVAVAVVFSILPAMRAAMLHPVRALRYE